MTTPTLALETTEFLAYMEEWYVSLRPFSLKAELEQPKQAAVFAADLVVGFCSQGPLASPRIEGIVPATVEIFKRANDLGVQHFVLFQDTHNPEAEEFHAFPPHCISGSSEAETVPALKELPFSDKFTVVEKNSLHPSLGNDFDHWMEEHSDLQEFIVVGDCTDLCAYSVAMHLRLRANSRGLKHRVILPVDAVQTYDMPIETAK